VFGPQVAGSSGRSLYFSNQKVFRTRDGGDHWTPISPDLTRPNPDVPANLDPPTIADVESPAPRRGVVYTIAPSPSSDDDIWAGTDDGLVWRTTDGGKTWRDVTPKGLSAWSKVGAIEPSHFDPQVAYLGIDRHRLDDQNPYILRTADGGRSWQPIVAGLADGGEFNAVNVVREDPGRRGLLFAGTERGVFVSFDDGGIWGPLQAGLPTTSVRDITIHGDDLVIATHGRGFWILDDIETLRQLAADGAVSTRLFAPATAVRARPSGFTGTPKPKDEPMAPNPPPGAYIDYLLSPATKGSVTIEIRDAAGALVRAFSSDTPVVKPDLAHLPMAPEWLPPKDLPSAAPGGHRLVWDLRYAAPPGMDDPFGPGGVWAPPGRYEVTLRAGGARFTQTLMVIPDPRVTASPESYGQSFALARLIEADRVRAREALKRMSAGKPAPPPPSGPSGPPAPDTLEGIAERLATLQVAVDGADGGPTPDARAGFDIEHRMLEAALAAADRRNTSVAPESH
jgi:hypothetical protein